MRKIPTKNYFILFFITIISILIVMYLVNLYKSREDYNDNVNHRMSFLREIYADDFNNYITENTEGIIYLSNSSDSSLATIEKKLKKDILKKEYSQDIIYINLKNIGTGFVNTINNYYSSTLKLNQNSGIPNVLIIKNGKIQRVYYINDDTEEHNIIDFMGLYYND